MRSLLITIYISILIACTSNTEANKESSVVLPKPEKKIEKQEVPDDKFSPKNAVEKLTKYGEENKETKAVIITKYGKIYLKLYDDTPLHRASFVMLAKKGFYDSTLFYRVRKNFVIQGGNSDSEETEFKFWEIGSYRIPPEIKSNHIHKRGAIALAIPENSEDGYPGFSSPFNFYIVQGYKFTERSLKKQEEENGFIIPSQNRSTYFNIGGAPHLDGKYTVFGEVTSGFEVIDKIAELKTNVSDFPEEDVYLTVTILE